MARIGAALGAERLGASIYELPAGQSICPYHYEFPHEEWLLVLEGQATVRPRVAMSSSIRGTSSASRRARRGAQGDECRELTLRGAVPLDGGRPHGRCVSRQRQDRRRPPGKMFRESDAVDYRSGETAARRGAATLRGCRSRSLNSWTDFARRRLVAATLRCCARLSARITTGQLDAIARRPLRLTRRAVGADPDLRLPASICVSIDDQVVHGIPGRRVLRAGNWSRSTWRPSSMATTPTPRSRWRSGRSAGSPAADRRHRAGLSGECARPSRGRHCTTWAGDRAHGPRARPERDPRADRSRDRPPDARGADRLRTGARRERPVLEPGSCLRSSRWSLPETPESSLERDGWTVRTADRSLTAHEEHTIMVADGGPVVSHRSPEAP